MGDADVVLPADDRSFDEFKHLCKEEKGWQEVYSKKSIRVCTKALPNSNIKLMRAASTFSDVTAATVFDVVHDTDYRRQWDKDMMEMMDICKLCVNNSVGYYAVKCPTPIKNRDCVFLCSWIAYPNMRDPEEYIMINRSVSHKDYPPKSGMVRAISILTGYHIKPLPGGQTEFTYLTQFDPRGSLPKWVVNTITQLFTPKAIFKYKVVITTKSLELIYTSNTDTYTAIQRIHKAAKRYPVWKAKHNLHHKPWLFPEQNRLPSADMSKLSSSVDLVDVIDETGLTAAGNNNFSDSDSDESDKTKKTKKSSH